MIDAMITIDLFKKLKFNIDLIDINNLQINDTNTIISNINKLLNCELEYRKSNAFNYRMKISRFPVINLLNIDKSNINITNIDILDIINNKKNMMFVGGPGSGKTYLSLYYGHKALELNFRVVYYKLNELSETIVKGKQTNTYKKLCTRIANYDMVIIDELGYTPINKESSYILFELLSNISENKTIVINTNLRFEEWGDTFGSNKSTKTLIDRITYNCHIIETGNKSFRHKQV